MQALRQAPRPTAATSRASRFSAGRGGPEIQKGAFEMENVKKNFGFGCMRLPMNGEQVDFEEAKRMVDASACQKRF